MGLIMITVEDAISAVREVLRNKEQSGIEIGAETMLRDLFFDSLDLAEVFIILEDKTGGELYPLKSGSLETVSDFARLSRAE